MSRPKLVVLAALALLMALPTSVAQAQEPVLISAQIAEGSALIWDDAALSDAITYTMTGVFPPAEGREYVGWLVRDEDGTKLSTGVISIQDGVINHTFDRFNRRYTGANLIDNFNRVVITDEAAATDPDQPLGPPVFGHAIPPKAMNHIRHVLSNWAKTGAGAGIATKLKGELRVGVQEADAASRLSDLAAIQTSAKKIINVIEGEGGDNYDATAGNPGDGFGVVTHAVDMKHAGFAAGEARKAAAADADLNVTALVENAAMAVIAGKNAETSAMLARDEALNVLKQTQPILAKIFIGKISGHLDNALNGRDANADGTIESVEGEGGAVNAYLNAQTMATFPLAGEAGALPPVTTDPGTPATGEAAVPFLAQLGLAASIVLLAIGSFLIMSTRRSGKHA
jgi:hypothetical protein